jgi:hypothetical protein
MSLIKEVIQGDLCAWFASLTGQLFIQGLPQPEGEQDAPRPTVAYGMVRVLTVSQLGHDRVTLQNQDAPDLDLIETVSGQRLVQVSINTYRDGAFDLINNIYGKLMLTRTIEHFNEINLGFVRRSEIRDLSALSSGSLEERHQFDLFLHAAASDTDVITAIESLNIIGRTYDYDEVININLNSE